MTAFEGFILSRQWTDSRGSQSLIFWLHSHDGPLKVVVENAESVLFISEADRARAGQALLGVKIRMADIELNTFYGDRAVACYFTDQRVLGTARIRLDEAGVKHFESDVRPTDRYLMERFIKGSAAVTGKVIDHGRYREVRNPRLGPSDYEPRLVMASVDIETSYIHRVIFSIAVATHSERIVFMIDSGPERTEGDIQYVGDERGAIEGFLDWVEKRDPDVLIGWSVVGFDLWFLQQRCDALNLAFVVGRNREPAAWRELQGRRFVRVPGRAVLDGIDLLRTATYSFESFSLESVSRELLGRGKLIHDVDSRAAEIVRLFEHDKPALASYNLEDCVLVLDIFDKTGLLEFAVQRARLTGLDVDRMGASVAAFDFLYLPLLHREGFVAPVVDEDSIEASPGGFVLDSQPGIYDNVIVMDFKSLYPSIIRTFHVDPLAMVTAGEDAIPGYRGGRFSRDRILLPRIIENLWLARDEAKREDKQANSQAIKIIMNSFYGVLGTPGCRFFDARLASSVTMRGHEIIQKTRDLIEGEGYRVIYGDTDSVFVLLGASVADPTAEGARLTTFLNTWWREHVATEYDLECFLEIEFETLFAKFLMPRVRGSEVGSKKRYAGMVKDGDSLRMVFKGLESVRSDWSLLAREFQQELYRQIFMEQPVDEYIKRTVEAVYAGDKDDKLILRRRLRRKLEEYTKNVPPHVKAARREEEIRKSRGFDQTPDFGGRWIEYVMTTNGAEPRRFTESPIDYQFYVDRQLAPIADAILCFQGKSFQQVVDKQLVLF